MLRWHTRNNGGDAHIYISIISHLYEPTPALTATISRPSAPPLICHLPNMPQTCHPPTVGLVMWGLAPTPLEYIGIQHLPPLSFKPRSLSSNPSFLGQVTLFISDGAPGRSRSARSFFRFPILSFYPSIYSSIHLSIYLSINAGTIFVEGVGVEGCQDRVRWDGYRDV